MKSKTSFFNKTIFLKNVTLYWPLWGIYTFILFCMQPFSLWMDYQNKVFYGESYTENLVSVIGLTGYIVVIACAAVLFGMALFNYLYNSKSANMIHALPTNKAELFGTNVISGLAFLIVPQIFNFVLTLFICLANGETKIEYLATWLVMVIAIDFIAFSFVTVCAFFTGLFFALPVYVVIVNLLSYWAYALVLVVVATFGYGVSNLGNLSQSIIELFSPILCFIENVDIGSKYDSNGVFIGIQTYGIPVILAYLVVAIVLYAIAYVTYQKGHIEKAGELITVQWLKPVFRWGVGISGGIFGSFLIYHLANELNISCGIPGFILAMLILGMVSYFAADMFVRKTFHVFKKENWKGCGCFSAVLLVCFFALLGVADMYENYLPEQEDVASAEVVMSYDILLDGENSGFIIDAHEQILANLEHCEALEKSGSYSERNEYISIRYYLKNGDNVYRHYSLPYEVEEIAAVINQVENMEKQPEVYLSSRLCTRYDEVTEFGTGWVEAYFVDNNEPDNPYGIMDTRSMTAEQVELLWAAVIADCKAGNLMKYDLDSSGILEEGETDNVSTASFAMQFKDPGINYGESASYSSYSYTHEVVYDSMYEESFSGAYLNFGPDCEHIIQTLIDCGIIESADDIDWSN